MRFLSRAMLTIALLGAVSASTRAAEIEALLPAETEGVLQVNARQILDSDLIKKFALGQIKQALEGNDAQKALKEIGLDPLKDIDRLTLGVWGEQPKISYVMVLHGKFDPAKLFEAAEKQAKSGDEHIAIVSEGKYKLVKMTPDSDDQPPVYFSVVNEKTIIGATDPKIAVKTVQAAETNAKPALKKDLAELVLKQDEKASLFLCGLVGDKLGNLPPGINIPNVDPKKLQEQIANVKDLSVTLRLSEDVGLEFAAGMKDDDSATDFGVTVASLVDTAKTFLPFAAAQQPMAKPVIDDLVKTLKSNVKKNNVVISLKLTADAITKATAGL